jgi:MtN3 and saliva related transmembrane protein
MEIAKLIGLMAASLTTISFFPQAIKIIRTRDAKSISLTMYVILVIGLSLWLVYGLMNNDTPIILANTITLIPTLVILGIKINERLQKKPNID